MLRPDTHLLILLPQISSILRFFIYKNLKIARSRAYALTVSSRRKPAEFWSQGYIEEWVSPPRPPLGVSVQGDHKSKEAKWISWILWWPTQLVLRHCESSPGYVLSQALISRLAASTEPNPSPPVAHLHFGPARYHHGRVPAPAVL